MAARTQQDLRYLLRIVLIGVFAVVHTVCLLALEADITITRFQTPDKAYAEFFIYILGSSVSVETDQSTTRASVNVTYFVESGAQVVAGDKYNLISSGDGPIADFMDLRRHFLDPGTYQLTVELTDNLNPDNTVSLTREFIMTAPSGALQQSDIQMLSTARPATEESVWVRNGMRLTPAPFAWYPEGIHELVFYHELYHSDIALEQEFYISYLIAADYNPDKVLIQGYKRLKPMPINSILQAIDISGLSSGEYVLSVEVHNQKKELLSDASITFKRDNPEIDQKLQEEADQYYATSFVVPMTDDSVRYALRAIAPLIAQTQVPVLNYLISKGEPETRKKFLHQYWTEKAPDNPAQAYAEFMRVAHVIDREFQAAFGYGFETDRGRIALKYGMPDDLISVSDEPSAPPYEIWIYHYFPATRQSNVRFLFYNPSLAGGAYELLHSTALGERQNRRWQQDLYRDALSEARPGDYIDAKDVQENVHRRAVEYFND